MPRLKSLALTSTGIGDAGLVALAPALRRQPALVGLHLGSNPFGDEGLAALVAPPPPAAGAPSPPTGVLKKLKSLTLSQTQVADAGCAALASAFDSDALPSLLVLDVGGILASTTAKAALEALLLVDGKKRFPADSACTVYYDSDDYESDGSDGSDEE